MRLLLDTHILLWAVDDPKQLSPATRDLLENPDNEVLFSAASIWEIAIKARLGRTDFPIDPDQIARTASETGFTELPVTAMVAARVADLPLHHRDPFDRLLLAQAIFLPAKFCTADAALTAYSDLVQLVAA